MKTNHQINTNILLLNKDGKRNIEIKNILNVSMSTIERCLKKYGLQNASHTNRNNHKIKIKELNEIGLTVSEIAAIVCRTPSAVRWQLSDMGLIANSETHSINIISDIEAICWKCKKTKLIEKFEKRKDSKPMSYCNECRGAQRSRRINSDINKYLSMKFVRVMARAKKKCIPFDLTLEQFTEQFNTQDGRCFYTDIEMICKSGSEKNERYAASIDRLIPSLGYTHGNVVFGCRFVNTVKNDLSLEELKLWIPSWYERISIFKQGPDARSCWL